MKNEIQGATSTEDMHDGSFGVFIYTTTNGLPSGTRKIQVCSITENEEGSPARPENAAWPDLASPKYQSRKVAKELATMLGYTYLTTITETKTAKQNWLQEVFDSKVEK
jgi:hypothetical protein